MPELPDSATCRSCGYSLRGLPTPVCPECGSKFNPGKRGTFRLSAGPYEWRDMVIPPRAWHRWTVVLATAAMLIDISSPGHLLDVAWLYLPLAILCTCIVTVDYLVRVAAAIASRILDGGSHDGTGNARRWSGWLVTPLCLALLVGAISYPWPAWIRFRVSLPAFERMAKAGLASNDWQFIGLYIVRKVSPQPNGVVYFVTGTALFGESGIAFLPTRPPLGVPLLVQHKLGPNWYIAENDW